MNTVARALPVPMIRPAVQQGLAADLSQSESTIKNAVADMRMYLDKKAVIPRRYTVRHGWCFMGLFQIFAGRHAMGQVHCGLCRILWIAGLL